MNKTILGFGCIVFVFLLILNIIAKIALWKMYSLRLKSQIVITRKMIKRTLTTKVVRPPTTQFWSLFWVVNLFWSDVEKRQDCTMIVMMATPIICTTDVYSMLTAAFVDALVLIKDINVCVWKEEKPAVYDRSYSKLPQPCTHLPPPPVWRKWSQTNEERQRLRGKNRDY